MRRCFGNRASGPIRVHGFSDGIDSISAFQPFQAHSILQMAPPRSDNGVVQGATSPTDYVLWLMSPPVSSVDHNVWGNGSTTRAHCDPSNSLTASVEHSGKTGPPLTLRNVRIRIAPEQQRFLI